MDCSIPALGSKQFAPNPTLIPIRYVICVYISHSLWHRCPAASVEWSRREVPVWGDLFGTDWRSFHRNNEHSTCSLRNRTLTCFWDSAGESNGCSSALVAMAQPSCDEGASGGDLEWVQYRVGEYLHCSLVVWSIQQTDFDRDGLWPLGGFLGRFGGFAGGLLRAIILPVVLWNLETKKKYTSFKALVFIINHPSLQWHHDGYSQRDLNLFYGEAIKCTRNYRNVVEVELTKPPWSGWSICSQAVVFVPSVKFWMASQKMKMS